MWPVLVRDPAGRADYFVALVQGIIAHGQAETALTLSEERLHGIVASALHGIVALDQRRRIVTFNPAAERRLRQLSAAVEQSPVAIIITDLAGPIEYVNPRLMKSGETPAAEYQRLWQTISSGRKWAGGLHKRKKSGELLWEFVRIMPVVSDKWVIINHMAVKEDITQRKASELRERIEQEQILHNARLIAMGEMAAALAHELNQPLTAIVNYAGMVERLLTTDAPDRQRLQQILAYIKEEALRGGKILWWMRDFVRKREPQREPADLNGVVRSVVRLAQISARASDVSIEMVFAEETSKLPIDRVQIEQVLFNLIGNGIEAMGSVAGERRLEIATRLVEEANELHVSVRDHGCGLPDRIAEDLFSPFFTTKPGGMGLGLSICRGIVEAHGGRIWAVPNDHGGTTFYFSLPLARQLT